MIQNVRYALRQLSRAPGFGATVIITLALGIGANAAIFTIFDQVLLRMLPVEKPKELVRFNWTGSFSGSRSSFGGESGDYFSYPMYKDLRDRSSAFSGIAAADRAGVGVSWHNQAENADAEIVSGNYFDVLGLHPAVGRLTECGRRHGKERQSRPGPRLRLLEDSFQRRQRCLPARRF